MRRLAFVLLAVLLVIPSGTFAATKNTSPETYWSYVRTSSFGSETQINRVYKDEDELYVYYLKNKKFIQEGKRSVELGKYDQVIWDFFVKVAGEKESYKNVAAYATARQGRQGLLAKVVFVQQKNPSWALVVNANNAGIGNVKWQRDMIGTLIHEYAHMLTLTKPQVDYKRSISSCEKQGRYYVGAVGCATKGKYLQTFTDTFWTQEDMEEADENAKIFYKKHEKDFVTQYAASNPEEDIAESFTDFILRTKPTGTSKADDKIRFFYQYPELVTMRNDMRARIAPYFGH